MGVVFATANCEELILSSDILIGTEQNEQMWPSPLK